MEDEDMANYQSNDSRPEAASGKPGRMVLAQLGESAHLELISSPATTIATGQEPLQEPVEDNPPEGFWQELREELLLLETRTGQWLLQAADPTTLERIQLQQRMESGEAVLMAGEVVRDAEFSCVNCGQGYRAHGSVMLPPCDTCGGDGYQLQSLPDNNH
jgi:Zinc-ribbon containing domain